MHSATTPFIRLLKRYKFPYTPLPTTYWVSERVRDGQQFPVEVHTAVSSDAAANIFTVGYTWVDGGQQSILSKYNPDGVLQWTYIDGGGGVDLQTTQNWYECIVIDPVDSSIYVAGRSSVTTSVDAAWWPVIAKFDQNGNKVWQHLLTLNKLSPALPALGSGVYTGLTIFDHPTHGHVVRAAAQYEYAEILPEGRTPFIVNFTTSGSLIGRKSMITSSTTGEVLTSALKRTPTSAWVLAYRSAAETSYLIDYPLTAETPPFTPAKYALSMTGGLYLIKLSASSVSTNAFMLGVTYQDDWSGSPVVVKHDLSQPDQRTGGWAVKINIIGPGDYYQGMTRVGDICHDDRTGDCFILTGSTIDTTSVVMRLSGSTGQVIWQCELKRATELFGINGIRYDAVTDSIMFTSATYAGDYSGCTLTKIPADGSKLGTYGEFTITATNYTVTAVVVNAATTTDITEQDLDTFLTGAGYELEPGPYTATIENTVDTYTHTVTSIP